MAGIVRALKGHHMNNKMLASFAVAAAFAFSAPGNATTISITSSPTRTLRTSPFRAQPSIQRQQIFNLARLRLYFRLYLWPSNTEIPLSSRVGPRDLGTARFNTLPSLRAGPGLGPLQPSVSQVGPQIISASFGGHRILITP